ncbi:hypothetical protein N9Z12_05335, partial [Opitutaceae bacterium]|nr:hypothetical protein [Opitutaceae bacterium]
SGSTTDSQVVAKVNVHNRGLSTVYSYNDNEVVTGVVNDDEGNVRIRMVYELKNGEPTTLWQHRQNLKGSWKDVRRFSIHGYREVWEPLFFNRDGRFLYLISRDEHDLGALHAFDTATLTLGPALFVPTEGEIRGAIMSRDGYELRGVS